LELNREEQEKFETEIEALASEETEGVMEIVTSWMKDGLKQGRREGRQQGIVEGQLKAVRDDVLEILEARFKRVPAGLKKTLKTIEDRKRLKLLLRQAATVASMKEFQRRLTEAA
jgi:flagellar biosynthesis/type III secretory pathway protein FliH